MTPCVSCRTLTVPVSYDKGIGVTKCPNDQCPKTLQLKREQPGEMRPYLRCANCGDRDFCVLHGSLSGSERACNHCGNEIKFPSLAPKIEPTAELRGIAP